MRGFPRLAPALLLASSLALGACSDSTSPDTVDPQVISGEIASVTTVFENNIAFQSLRTLSLQFPSYGATALLRSSLPAAPDDRGAWTEAAERSVRALQASAISRGPSGVLALFPSDVLGKTLTWDETTDAYVVSNRTGAPANGIRIILYAVNPVSGQPVEPVQELGSLELTDESNAQVNRLGVLLRLASTTVADYDITAQFGTASISVVVAGYLQRPDGSGRLNFSLSQSANLSGFSINYQITSVDGTAIVLQLTSGQTSATILFRVTHDGNSIEITGTETANAVDGVIRFNGTVVATITGNPDDPTITGADGRQITPADLAALESLISSIGDFLDEFAEGILAPADVVFGSTAG